MNVSLSRWGFIYTKEYSSNSNDLIDLSYDLYDKYNSENALVIAHGLFASKASWRSVARRINDLTKQKVKQKQYLEFFN